MFELPLKGETSYLPLTSLFSRFSIRQFQPAWIDTSRVSFRKIYSADGCPFILTMGLRDRYGIKTLDSGILLWTDRLCRCVRRTSPSVHVFVSRRENDSWAGTLMPDTVSSTNLYACPPAGIACFAFVNNHVLLWPNNCRGTPALHPASMHDPNLSRSNNYSYAWPAFWLYSANSQPTLSAFLPFWFTPMTRQVIANRYFGSRYD